MDLNTPNLTGLLQSRQCSSDMANRCFDAFGYVSLGSEVMNFKIAQHPFTQRTSSELIHSRTSRGTFATWWMFRIGNGPKKDAVQGVDFVGHGLRALKRLRNDRPYEEIESAVRPLVAALNSISGVRTIASCQGHIFGGSPYVYFEAPMQVASSIERWLREAAMDDQPQFQTNWIIQGWFNESYEMTFLLHSPKYHRHADGLLKSVWSFCVQRQRLNNELLAVASYLREQAMCANVWQQDEPRVGTQDK